MTYRYQGLSAAIDGVLQFGGRRFEQSGCVSFFDSYFRSGGECIIESFQVNQVTTGIHHRDGPARCVVGFRVDYSLGYHFPGGFQ